MTVIVPFAFNFPYIEYAFDITIQNNDQIEWVFPNMQAENV